MGTTKRKGKETQDAQYQENELLGKKGLPMLQKRTKKKKESNSNKTPPREGER